MGTSSRLRPPPELALAAISAALAGGLSLRALRVEALPAPPAPPPPRLVPDVNRAPPSQLILLPGVGAARARAIVDVRAERGPFGSVLDLETVRGIGPGTAAALLDDARADPIRPAGKERRVGSPYPDPARRGEEVFMEAD